MGLRREKMVFNSGHANLVFAFILFDLESYKLIFWAVTAQNASAALAQGWNPRQELEVVPCSGQYVPSYN